MRSRILTSVLFAGALGVLGCERRTTTVESTPPERPTTTAPETTTPSDRNPTGTEPAPQPSAPSTTPSTTPSTPSTDTAQTEQRARLEALGQRITAVRTQIDKGGAQVTQNLKDELARIEKERDTLQSNLQPSGTLSDPQKRDADTAMQQLEDDLGKLEKQLAPPPPSGT